MNESPHGSRFGLLAGLFLAAGLVFAALLVTRAWLKIAEGQTISVTGLARKGIVSDLIIWRGTFTTEAEKLLTAQRALKTDLGKIDSFLTSRGVSNHLFSPIGIQELTARPLENQGPQKTVGYRLSQTLEIRSGEVNRVLELARESTLLIEQEVAFVAQPPEFIYTKAGEAKIEMLADAIRDAKSRAEQIAQHGGRKLGRLRSARMGVFQITPAFSTATSWEGINDTTTLDKTITVTVTATFAME
jgi:hypothetical protein